MPRGYRWHTGAGIDFSWRHAWCSGLRRAAPGRRHDHRGLPGQRIRGGRIRRRHGGRGGAYTERYACRDTACYKALGNEVLWSDEQRFKVTFRNPSSLFYSASRHQSPAYLYGTIVRGDRLLHVTLYGIQFEVDSNTGTLAHNRDLSDRRAAAVVSHLASAYGIAPERLLGVGSLRRRRPGVSQVLDSQARGTGAAPG